MKSIKLGRGPSMMGGVSSIFVALFGVVWTMLALEMGGGLFALFGVCFVGIAIVQAVYQFKNATSKNRYSAFDITEDDEEPDPLNERFGQQYDSYGQTRGVYGSPEDEVESEFCPYCGVKVAGDFAFCNKCGKQLP